MKKLMRFFGPAAAALLLLGACATGPYVQKENKILNLVDLINRGGVNEVKGLSAPPFLFDGEIILLENHLAVLWRNLHAAGFRLRDVRVTRNERLSEDSYRLFADSMEVRAFFKKYLDKHTSLVKIEARGGSYYLLLNREVGGFPRIQGLKGPFE